MNIDRDEVTGATYVRFSGESVARTVDIDDLVMVDIDSNGQPVGIDFAVNPNQLTRVEMYKLQTRFPSLTREMIEVGLLTKPELEFGEVVKLVGINTGVSAMSSVTFASVRPMAQWVESDRLHRSSEPPLLTIH